MCCYVLLKAPESMALWLCRTGRLFEEVETSRPETLGANLGAMPYWSIVALPRRPGSSKPAASRLQTGIWFGGSVPWDALELFSILSLASIDLIHGTSQGDVERQCKQLTLMIKVPKCCNYLSKLRLQQLFQHVVTGTIYTTENATDEFAERRRPPICVVQ